MSATENTNIGADGIPRSGHVAGDPLWFKDAVIYQLHVKSFFDANDDGVGDFAGLIQKLDYIAGLGVNTLWLLPFYPSPRRDDGYDIAEYCGVHPDYGDMDDVRRFFDEAHRRGLRIITELVINHTSDQHEWFQRARQAPKGSPEREFYVWSDSDHALAGTRIIFCDTEKSNWTWDPVAGQYYWHRFYSHQPDLNFDNPEVLEAVLRVMRFWLDLGVDGLRLDAVPYLIEREGTSNENLPETHAILKKIRAEVDAHYPDRLLLAEANMWPEDTQQYFGDGDECHMAFHFPLMPRMYMAIAREDRFPISDILRQTPAIPDNCQWAIFLRNHDELTLEMVTDSERDYLWQTYAADQRARINLGIRRRLAPLLERDRRRIELMNSLLLTMPGTPVLYYGDEIGMGDNIHLGDRDGVRTPMQWSIDRNGGFSRADPARLVLPPLMDPLYGFQTINVESQQRDLHSLLNWTRRMLEVRNRYRAFGRGTLTFLYPGNRKILAYLREFEDELVLCVANLSRTLQAVELDLTMYDGRIPVEIVGGTSFPPIGHEFSYLLTLPAYGFYAFQLVTDGAMPDWHVPPVQAMPEFETLVLRGTLVEEGLERPRELLEHKVLPVYLCNRRWFAAKDQGIDSVRIAYAQPLEGGEGDLLMTEVDVALGPDGSRHERYLLPLGIAWEAEDLPALPQQLALTRVRRGRNVGFLTDAFAAPTLASAVVTAMKAGTRLQTPDGEIRFEATDWIARIGIDGEQPVRWLSAEQSNSSLVIGNTAVLKLVRRITPGINPETEMGRHLTTLGYGNIAPLLGEVVRVDDQGVPSTLMVLQGFLQNQGDAWRWTLDYLHRTFDEFRLTPPDEDRHEELLCGYDAFATAVGRRLGELHQALALPSDDPAFAPEDAGDAQITDWVESARTQLERAFRALGGVESPSPAQQHLMSLRPRLEPLLRRLANAAPGALLTRVHGDFHLGQILVVQDDAYLIDFEGEPARPPEERRARTSPLRDVAGFLRSLDYAAAMLERGEEGVAPAVDERSAEFLAAFRQRSGGHFRAAYLKVLQETARPWAQPDAVGPLLALFLIEKGAYEIAYEAANRPAWIDVPVRGLATLLDELLEDGHD
ncbi:maltose alpha-D-glucosyltransferase [Luteimonas sp. YGD11-2]|uniref:maltose alpha-D-glucosyltransferase n=1 Tax=Luteimonas sp. YGD11-2 TaxID=2508168 RepID=UPI00100A3601|nr:maltose alpha-D-glucosyltransferase [Luteimonas sp. YGD11-2]